MNRLFSIVCLVLLAACSNSFEQVERIPVDVPATGAIDIKASAVDDGTDFVDVSGKQKQNYSMAMDTMPPIARAYQVPVGDMSRPVYSAPSSSGAVRSHSPAKGVEVFSLD